VILTGVEHDHTDLYPRVEDLEEAFRHLVELLPPEGHLVAYGDSPEVREVARAAACPVTFYGLEEGNDLHPLSGVQEDGSGSRFAVAAALGREGSSEGVEIHLPLPGAHNVLNALGVWGAVLADGLAPGAVAEALGHLRGVARRLEELGTAAGVTVIDDFAHHPTAVGKSLEALGRRYPGRRRMALFEPRSLSAARGTFQAAYLEAFLAAHRVLLAPAFHAGRLPPEERMDLEEVVRELTARGVEATACQSVDEVFRRAMEEARRGDVVVTMSSGAFGGLPRRILESLAGREKG
jgi:UDP-N-acetylmuramate: L-alanyl-gamma-D-glutamyl-meso-diaminopimelate ligase